MSGFGLGELEMLLTLISLSTVVLATIIRDFLILAKLRVYSELYKFTRFTWKLTV